MSRRYEKADEASVNSSDGQPRNWDDINRRLARLGHIEQQAESLQARLDRKVAELKERTLEASRELEREREKLRNEVECFYWAHREEVLADGRKSIELPFGRLGSRSSRRVVVDHPAAAQQWLAANGLEQFLRIRTELDREALRSVLLAGSGNGNGTFAKLVCCPGVHLCEKQEFWCEATRATPLSIPVAANGNSRPLRKKLGLESLQRTRNTSAAVHGNGRSAQGSNHLAQQVRRTAGNAAGANRIS